MVLFLINCNIIWAQSLESESSGFPDWLQVPSGRWDICMKGPFSNTQGLCHAYDNQAAGEDRASKRPGNPDLNESISWSFRLRYPNNPSSSNSWAIYLLSERDAAGMHPDSLNRALIIGVNLTGTDDSLRFYLQNGKKPVPIGSTGVVWDEYADSSWAFNIGYSPENLLFSNITRPGGVSITKSINSELKNLLNHAEYFGVFYRYTSTKDRLLGISGPEISGTFISDTLPPRITGHELIDEHTIRLYLDEVASGGEIIAVLLETGDTAVAEHSEREMLLYFPSPLGNKMSYRILVNNLTDRYGNQGTQEYAFDFFQPSVFDVRINEVMADPEPRVYQAPAEYIELFNRSGFNINLKDWTLSAGSRNWVFGDYSFESDSFLVVGYGENNSCCAGYLPLFSSASVITNEGQEIILRDKKGTIIDAVYFKKEWYKDPFKEEGGWSLEAISTDYYCTDNQNWLASTDPTGGTPGRVNSVRGMVETGSKPFIVGEELTDDSTLCLWFSEPMGRLGNDSLPGIEMIQGQSVPEISFIDSPWFRGLKLRFPDTLSARNALFRFPSILESCSGTELTINDTFSFPAPKLPVKGDVILTEIMFAPLPGCAEFFEILNRSGSSILLSDLRFEAGSAALNGPGELLSSKSFILAPGRYLAVTNSPEQLIACHENAGTGRYFMPDHQLNLPDANGIIRISDRSGNSLDLLSYSPEMHFPLLTDYHGVSLERLNLDESTGNESIWHSASSLSGYATPGYENSRQLTDAGNVSSFSSEPEIFSPDNDGREDLVILRFKLDREDYIGTVRIFDALGRMVCVPGMNELLSRDGYFVWDGRSSGGQVCPTGIYLVQLDAWHMSGSKKRLRTTVVLAKP